MEKLKEMQIKSKDDVCSGDDILSLFPLPLPQSVNPARHTSTCPDITMELPATQ